MVMMMVMSMPRMIVMNLYSFDLVYPGITFNALYESGIIQAKSEKYALMKLDKRYRSELENGFQIFINQLELNHDGICVTYEFWREE